MEIRPATLAEVPELVRMGQILWPDDPAELLEDEFRQALADDDQECFLCRCDGQDAGFAIVSLRAAHVPGAETSPVGYLEGIFVYEQFRRRGLARALNQAAEDWAHSRGCSEMGSDTWDWNTSSQVFHQQVGYQLYETLVHFIKRI